MSCSAAGKQSKSYMFDKRMGCWMLGQWLCVILQGLTPGHFIVQHIILLLELLDVSVQSLHGPGIHGQCIFNLKGKENVKTTHGRFVQCMINKVWAPKQILLHNSAWGLCAKSSALWLSKGRCPWTAWSGFCSQGRNGWKSMTKNGNKSPRGHKTACVYISHF